MMMNVLDKAKYQPPDLMKPSKMTIGYEYKPEDPHEVKPLPKLPKTPIFRPKSPDPTSDCNGISKVYNNDTDRDKTPDGGKKSRLTINIGNKVVDRESVTEREMQLIKRAEDLQEDLVLALGATEDIAALKGKLKDVVDKLSQEKIWRADLIAENKRLVDKQTMFTDHIEKLTFQLKHMAIGKMKEKDEAMSVREENKFLLKKIRKQKRWAMSAKKCIDELKANNKLLNGQLNIMDENFTRVRLSLDAAKTFQNKQVNDAVNESHELRVKYASTSGKMLDEVYLPPDSPYIDRVRSLDRQRRKKKPETTQSLDRGKELPRPSTAGAARSGSNKGSSKDSLFRDKYVNGDNRPNTAGHSRAGRNIENTHNKHSHKLDRILNKISDRKTESTHNPAEIWSKDRLNALLAKSGLHHDPPEYKPT